MPSDMTMARSSSLLNADYITDSQGKLLNLALSFFVSFHLVNECGYY